MSYQRYLMERKDDHILKKLHFAMWKYTCLVVKVANPKVGGLISNFCSRSPYAAVSLSKILNPTLPWCICQWDLEEEDCRCLYVLRIKRALHNSPTCEGFWTVGETRVPPGNRTPNLLAVSYRANRGTHQSAWYSLHDFSLSWKNYGEIFKSGPVFSFFATFFFFFKYF